MQLPLLTACTERMNAYARQAAPNRQKCEHLRDGDGSHHYIWHLKNFPCVQGQTSEKRKKNILCPSLSTDNGLNGRLATIVSVQPATELGAAAAAMLQRQQQQQSTHQEAGNVVQHAAFISISCWSIFLIVCNFDGVFFICLCWHMVGGQGSGEPKKKSACQRKGTAQHSQDWQ